MSIYSLGLVVERLLRYSKLTVADEIENALSYYEATFLRDGCNFCAANPAPTA